jgi:protein disulfide-isomerase A6
MVKVGAVDADEAANKPLAARFGVEGFPTIKVFTKASPGGEDYAGARTGKAMTEHMLGLLASSVASVTTANNKKVMKDKALPWALLFTKKPTTPAIFKALSTQLAGQVRFGEIGHKQKTLISRYNIKKFPTVCSCLPSTVCPQLSAVSYCLPSATVRPQLLFALN